MNFLKIIASLIYDGCLLFFPRIRRTVQPYRYAFIVHPRNHQDMFRKLPFMKIFSYSLVRIFERHFWPIIVSRITGLKDEKGVDIEGFVISIPMTAKEMLYDRKRALYQIRQAVSLAKYHGAQIVGLGALTSSLSHGGLLLTDIPDIGITTGHAHTGFTVSETLLSLIHKTNIPLAEITIGIVGAAGSIGTITAQLLARHGIRNFLLIDLTRKHESIRELKHSLTSEFAMQMVTISDDLSLLKNMQFIVTATNAEGAVVNESHISPGTIIVDDAQPSDIDQLLLATKDVLVVSAGAVHTPNIHTHFSLGLRGRETNYCCLAEVLALASEKKIGHFVLNRPNISMVDEISIMSRKLGFEVAAYQNTDGLVSPEHVNNIIQLVRNRLQYKDK